LAISMAFRFLQYKVANISFYAMRKTPYTARRQSVPRPLAAPPHQRISP
jgi:hypothetical protein